MSKRQYKNVYTILEKVKKGEIQSYYKEEESLFSKLQFYKKPDLIKPYLHFLDESKLDTIVHSSIATHQGLKDEYERLKKDPVFTSLAPDKKISSEKFWSMLRDMYGKIPEHVKRDIFKMYYNKLERIEFEERTDKNKSQYKFIEKANSPVGKIMTESSNLKSAIFTKNIMLYLLIQMVKMELEEKGSSDKIGKMLNDSSKSPDGDDLLNKLFESNQSKEDLEKALDKAKDICKSIDDVLDNESQELLFKDISDRDGSDKLSVDYIKEAAADLKRIKMTTTSLKERIKKLLDKSLSYFSAKKKIIIEDLFNSDNIAGLDEYIELHPKLRKLFVEDITVKETESIGKIDVYIDISGSMSSPCGADIDQQRVSRIDFAKAFVIKLKEMELLKEVYVFDSKVRKYKNDDFSIAILQANGGTDIDKVVYKIKNGQGENAIIITDAEDRCNIYSDKAFFIGLRGCKFHYFDKDVLEKYVDNHQVVMFDGIKIHNIDRSTGMVVK